MQLTSLLVVVAAVFGMASAQSTPPKFNFGTANPNMIGVKARNKLGPTNPAMPSLGTPINQTSVARLLSINSVDDWCTFSSPDGKPIADTESYTVAYCTKARNNARVIPDGTVTAAHFVKTPLYVQLMALGDFTKIGIQAGDEGGELDPHGATNMGNPIGGNVTSNVSGQDVFYEEWMNYVSYQQVCVRVCIAGSEIAPTPLECQHTLDEMGCNWVMPGDYSDNSFDTCEGDSAYPPGLYPQGNGQTSTFQQYYSSVYTAPNGGGVQTFVNGSPTESTPSAAYSLPATSQCTTTSTIANGIKEILPSGSSSAPGGMSTKTSGSSGSSESGGSSGSSSNPSSNASSGGKSSGAAYLHAPTIMAGTLVAFVAGAAAFLG
ncbi:uncharacterized protein FA14DRAFT_159660 [Meira miltonrushii]|uniref:Macrofage activating glyco protein n=1 Tax=Meira miltonrushii TaxID=1280837 RepID=A0A316VJC1_9BASI|nr:uncharacterized protein FA14DRAFT_159660 [Meira miltonrushii]PWN37777.1 hypothetical protein FA14DRAFT_159660 [Meira miltonrushii]